MEQTRQNLLRVSDIVAEIERSLASLKRQARRPSATSSTATSSRTCCSTRLHRLLEMIVVERVEREALGTAVAHASASRTQVEADEMGLIAARGEASSVEERSEEAAQSAFRADNDVNALAAELTRARTSSPTSISG